jgi:uncharacterized protein (TIGR00251 family)
VSLAAQVALRADGASVLVKVAARPGTGADRVMGVHGDALKLGVSAAPEKGKANKALAALLALVLEVKKSSVELASGETAREKLFRVSGVGVETVRAALERALAGD